MNRSELLLLFFLVFSSLTVLILRPHRKRNQSFNPLLGLRSAVLITQSEMSIYNCQEIIERQLYKNGIELVTISPLLLLKLLKNKVYPLELIELNLDLVAVGHILSLPRILKSQFRGQWYKKSRDKVKLGYSHSIFVRIYGQSGNPLSPYEKQIVTEDFLTAFEWFAKDVIRHISKELAFGKN